MTANSLKGLKAFVELFEEIQDEYASGKVTNGEVSNRALEIYGKIKTFDSASAFLDYVNPMSARELVEQTICLAVLIDTLQKAMQALRSVAVGKLAGFEDVSKLDFARVLLINAAGCLSTEINITDEEASLESMQSLIGGYIEVLMKLNLSNGSQIYFLVNEEGHLAMSPSVQTSRHGTIYGPILVHRVDDEGKTVSLTDEDVALLNLRLDESVSPPLLLVGEPT
jgi:hypothetical protein